MVLKTIAFASMKDDNTPSKSQFGHKLSKAK